ncbi:MAG TPA: hypothetical protein VGF18_00935 [Candidatus Tumulicola sp.]|jgi:hypothetical protein
MQDATFYTAGQAAAANAALRAALDLPPQRFTAEQFVGMISEEIEQLRAAGRSDSDISELLQSKAGISVSTDEIGRYYVDEAGRAGHP